MIGRSGSRTRAALFTLAMNLRTIEGLDLLRYLRVPAIHLVVRRDARRNAARWCRDCTPRRIGRETMAQTSKRRS